MLEIESLQKHTHHPDAIMPHIKLRTRPEKAPNALNATLECPNAPNASPVCPNAFPKSPLMTTSPKSRRSRVRNDQLVIRPEALPKIAHDLIQAGGKLAVHVIEEALGLAQAELAPQELDDRLEALRRVDLVDGHGELGRGRYGFEADADWWR